MADGDGTGGTGGSTGGSTGGTGTTTTFTAITTQEDFDRAVGERVNRERAKFSDYDELKAKAAKLDEAEAKTKTELQKERERADKAERERDTATHNALKTSVASSKGVPASSISGTTKEELEASADELIAWRDANKRPPRQPKDLKSGSTGSGENTTGKERAAAALRDYRRGA